MLNYVEKCQLLRSLLTCYTFTATDQLEVETRLVIVSFTLFRLFVYGWLLILYDTGVLAQVIRV